MHKYHYLYCVPFVENSDRILPSCTYLLKNQGQRTYFEQSRKNIDGATVVAVSYIHTIICLRYLCELECQHFLTFFLSEEDTLCWPCLRHKGSGYVSVVDCGNPALHIVVKWSTSLRSLIKIKYFDSFQIPF